MPGEACYLRPRSLENADRADRQTVQCASSDRPVARLPAAPVFQDQLGESGYVVSALCSRRSKDSSINCPGVGESGISGRRCQCCQEFRPGPVRSAPELHHIGDHIRQPDQIVIPLPRRTGHGFIFGGDDFKLPRGRVAALRADEWEPDGVERVGVPTRTTCLVFSHPGVDHQPPRSQINASISQRGSPPTIGIDPSAMQQETSTPTTGATRALSGRHASPPSRSRTRPPPQCTWARSRR